MEFFKASVQYDDWEVTVAADGAHASSALSLKVKSTVSRTNAPELCTSRPFRFR
jgi:hypothetical protein